MKTITSEWELIEQINSLIKKQGIKPSKKLIRSIGDDCAVFRPDDSRLGLLTTDISIESVHFSREYLSPEDIGFRAMMGNISDITAKGGKPVYALVSLGIPSNFSRDYIIRLYRGILLAAGDAGTVICGGDTSLAGELIINIALYGQVKPEDFVSRAGASSGDIIYVTGELGGAMAGMEALKAKDRRFPSLSNKHKRPMARHGIIKDLIKRFKPTSMIDISDGLLSDLGHICRASNTGFRIYTEKLPVPDELAKYASAFRKESIKYALQSGEEYELLFTSKKMLDGNAVNIDKVPVTAIGEILKKNYYLSDKKISKRELHGYEHFR